MRPFHHQLWAYGIYGGLGASFGFWLQGVEDKQMRFLRDSRNRLLEKRRRRAEREGGLNPGSQQETDAEIGVSEIARAPEPVTGRDRPIGLAARG